MPQYAQYNPAIAAPSPVTGWYDTDLLSYPNLPPLSDLLQVTAAQWTARMANPSGWAVSNGALVAFTPPAPVLTLAQQATLALAAGITITSTGTPSLNGTYTCDATAQARITSVQAYIQANGKFPGSTTTMTWVLMNGSVITFPTTSEFTAFATAVANYVWDLDEIILTNAGTLPVAADTIS
jgi:hypothetical protein